VRLRHLRGAVTLPVTRAEIGDDFGEVGGRKMGRDVLELVTGHAMVSCHILRKRVGG
jgi:hypothetical protein